MSVSNSRSAWVAQWIR